ncbi:hypothetical protein BT63DRAFT_420311 [Microthyrium microscopicum]|uniref:Ig-like domain-containing protein n=1 Tax=Microthyrium microscopicum TaxID=703497 RepID=A0A6A6UUG1_9PEZI|nr:hypothetical protein BT63DRAFT_420311 [Microthyrium microscopicum]
MPASSLLYVALVCKIVGVASLEPTAEPGSISSSFIPERTGSATPHNTYNPTPLPRSENDSPTIPSTPNIKALAGPGDGGGHGKKGPPKSPPKGKGPVPVPHLGNGGVPVSHSSWPSVGPAAPKHTPEDDSDEEGYGPPPPPAQTTVHPPKPITHAPKPNTTHPPKPVTTPPRQTGPPGPKPTNYWSGIFQWPGKGAPWLQDGSRNGTQSGNKGGNGGRNGGGAAAGLPDLELHGGGGMHREQFCSSLIATAFPKVMMSFAQGHPIASQSVTVTLPGYDRPANSWKECMPAYGPFAWTGGRAAPWGDGPPPVIVVSGGNPSPDEEVCKAASATLGEQVQSVFASASSSRIAHTAYGPLGGRATATIHGGPCIKASTYPNGRVPGIYPSTAVSHGSAVPGVAPSTGVSGATMTPAQTAAPTTENSAAPTPEGKLGPLEVMTGDIAICRQYPDFLTNDWSHVYTLERHTVFKSDCWTVASLPGEMGSIQGSNIWLHDSEHNCWFHDQLLADPVENISKKLQYCKSPGRFVAGLLPQYSRQDCYDGPSLDATSVNLGSGDYVDVSCQIFGEEVRGNHTWIKATQGCYMPGAVFDESKWRGSALQRCT